jgi:hypothetical protein
MRLSAALAALILTGACASGSTPAPGPAAPAVAMNKTGIIVRIKASTANVGAEMETPRDGDVAGIVWIENRSTDTVMILTVTLHECLNVRPACDVPIPVKMKLAPNARHQALRVLRKASGVLWAFTYTYEWSADGAVQRGVNSLEKQLHPADIAKLGDKIAFLKADPDSVTIERGGVLVASQLHIVALGTQRELLGQFRGSFDFRVQAGPVNLIQPDTIIGVAAGRVVLTLAAGNPGGVRKDPFPPLKINLIVR